MAAGWVAPIQSEDVTVKVFIFGEYTILISFSPQQQKTLPRRLEKLGENRYTESYTEFTGSEW